ncbi:hypothetical protein [Endothiovibrio diazotrophicus]
MNRRGGGIRSASTTPTPCEKARGLEALIEEAATTHHPILVDGARHNAVLLAEPDRHNITETLRRLSTALVAGRTTRHLPPPSEEVEEFRAD